MRRRYLYRLLIWFVPVSVFAQWTPEVWEGAHVLRQPAGAEGLLMTNLYGMWRETTIEVRVPEEYGVFHDWDGGYIEEEATWWGEVKYYALDYEINADWDTNEVEVVGGDLVWTGGWKHVRFAIADVCDEDIAKWQTSFSYEHEKELEWVVEGETNTGYQVWSIEEEFGGGHTNLFTVQSEDLRFYEIYMALRERWLALGRSFVLGGSAHPTHVFRNADTNLVFGAGDYRLQFEIPIEKKYHYGRNVMVPFVPRRGEDGSTDEFFGMWPETNGWPGMLEFRAATFATNTSRRSYFHPGWVTHGSFPSSSFPSNIEKAKSWLAELLVEFADTSLMSDGNYNEYFQSMDSNNPSAWVWRNYITGWFFPWECGTISQNRDAFATSYARYWDLERHPESVPNWTKESFFRAHTNIPHYFKPVSVSTTYLTGVVITNTYFSQVNCVVQTNEYTWDVVWWSVTDDIAWGWQSGETNQRYASEGIVRTNYQLTATWFDWAADRHLLMYEYPEYGEPLTTRWHIVTHQYQQASPTNMPMPLASTNTVIDALGRNNVWRYVRILNVSESGDPTVYEVDSVELQLKRWWSAASNIVVWSETFDDPTNVWVEGVWEQDVIAPGFQAMDYGMHHATSVVAAMTHTVHGFASNTFYTLDRTREREQMEIYNYIGYTDDPEHCPPPSDPWNPSSYTNYLAVSNEIWMVSEVPPAEGSLDMTERRRYRYYYTKRETIESGHDPTYCWPGDREVHRTAWDEDDDDQRHNASMQVTSRPIPANASGANVSLYLIYPRRMETGDDVTEWQVISLYGGHFLDPPESARPILQEKRRFIWYQGMDGAGGRFVPGSAQAISPGEAYSTSIGSQMAFARQNSSSNTYSASGSATGTDGYWEGITVTTDQDVTKRWHDWREIRTIPRLVYEWDFQYK